MKEISKKSKETIDFIGIGAAKSGSTWLAKCLEEHPDILMSSQKSTKELYFFNSTKEEGGKGFSLHEKDNKTSFYNRGTSWYLKQFPDYQKGKIRGEFSISYLPDTEAAKRIKKFNPNIKILAILRNPTEAINSSYWFIKTRIDNEDIDISDIIKKGFLVDDFMYYKGLKRFFDVFPKKNIKVIILEDVKINPLTEIQKVYQFLGVDPNFVPPSLKKRVNKSVASRSEFIKKFVSFTLNAIRAINLKYAYKFLKYNRFLYKIYKKINIKNAKYEKFDEKTRSRIKEIYKKDIENLEKLLDKDLSAWK